MTDTRTPFWKNKTLAEMTPAEWESLCDGCGRCCLLKLEDEDTNALYYTNIACHLLDDESCRCSDYANRVQRIPECLVIQHDNPEHMEIMPTTCAYYLLAKGEDLPDWHPLVTGDPDSVHQAGISVLGKVVSELYIHPDQLTDHIIDWISSDCEADPACDAPTED